MELDQFISLVSALGDFGALVDGTANLLGVISSEDFVGSVAGISAD